MTFLSQTAGVLLEVSRIESAVEPFHPPYQSIWCVVPILTPSGFRQYLLSSSALSRCFEFHLGHFLARLNTGYNKTITYLQGPFLVLPVFGQMRCDN